MTEMYRSYNPGAIGVKINHIEEGIDLAAGHGFEGYHFRIEEAARMGPGKLRELAESKGIRLSAWGFPVNFRGTEEEYRKGIESLPALSQVAAHLDVRRTSTWIVPCSDELTYAENFEFHVRRLRPAAAILAEHGIRFGLEYVAPKTLWTSRKHEFAHTMKQMAELCRALGPEVGFLLDSWHWYNARETVEDLLRLSPEQVVDVHLNDAPDVPIDEQIDNVRTLPGETDVIDIVSFLGALQRIGYDGPVMVEPFSADLREMSPDAASAATGRSLNTVWERAGL